ncbi:MAG: thioredoxin [Planctomycetota bacterium]
MTTSTIAHLNESDFEAVTAEGITLVDFWAPWCGPCRMIGPALEELAGQVDEGVTIAKVNVDDNPALARKLSVSAIPLIVVFKDGREIDRLVGLQSLQALQQAIGRAK